MIEGSNCVCALRYFLHILQRIWTFTFMTSQFCVCFTLSSYCDIFLHKIVTTQLGVNRFLLLHYCVHRVLVGPGWKFAIGSTVPSRNNKYCCHIDQMTKQDCFTQQRPLGTQMNSHSSMLHSVLNQI